MTPSKALVWLAKAGLVFLALMAASVVAGAIFYAGYQAPEGAGEVDEVAMMRVGVVVQAVNALMLSALATRTRLSCLGAVALLFALFFFVQTFLSMMELVFFAEFFEFDMRFLPRNAGMAALTALVGSIAAVLLFAGTATREAVFEARSRRSTLWRFALATALYPVAYWTAGYFIVTPSETARAFYGDDFTGQVEPGPLLAFQIFRGVIWAGLALAAAYGLRGSRVERAILVGAAFSIFMILPLLYPNPLMPEPVRMLHFVEMAISNSIYGILATLLLAPRRRLGVERGDESGGGRLERGHSAEVVVEAELLKRRLEGTLGQQGRGRCASQDVRG